MTISPFADMTHSEHRLYVELNGLKVHLYNRTSIYSQLEKFFGLESLLLPGDSTNSSDLEKSADPQDMSFWTSWRDLIPVIKIDLNMVIILVYYFGNWFAMTMVHNMLFLTFSLVSSIAMYIV